MRAPHGHRTIPAGGIFIYREGATSRGRVRGSFREALAAAKDYEFGGVMVSDRLGSPTIAGSHDLGNIALIGEPGLVTPVSLADGAVLQNLNKVDGVGLVSFSSAPIVETPDFLFVQLVNGANLSTALTATAPFFNVASGKTLSLDVGSSSYVFTSGLAPTVQLEAGGSGLVFVGQYAAVYNDCIAGDLGCSLLATIMSSSGSFAVQSGVDQANTTVVKANLASYIHYDAIESARWNNTPPDTMQDATDQLVARVDKFSFGADALVALTATAQIIPPGSRATSTSSATPGHVMAVPASVARLRVRHVGNAANAGQTVAYELKKNGSLVLATVTLATNAGQKSGETTFSTAGLAADDVLTLHATPSALLTASPTDIMGAAA